MPIQDELDDGEAQEAGGERLFDAYKGSLWLRLGIYSVRSPLQIGPRTLPSSIPR